MRFLNTFGAIDVNGELVSNSSRGFLNYAEGIYTKVTASKFINLTGTVKMNKDDAIIPYEKNNFKRTKLHLCKFGIDCTYGVGNGAIKNLFVCFFTEEGTESGKIFCDCSSNPNNP